MAQKFISEQKDCPGQMPVPPFHATSAAIHFTDNAISPVSYPKHTTAFSSKYPDTMKNLCYGRAESQGVLWL